MKKKIAITHPRIGKGGSEAAAFYAIEALVDDYDVTLITGNSFNFEEIVDFYDLSISIEDIHIRYTPMPQLLHRTHTAAALRGAFYHRFCRKVSNEYDLLICAYNIGDFKKRTINLIADFSWDDEINREYSSAFQGKRHIFYKVYLLRASYLYLSRLISNFSLKRALDRNNMVLANSIWSANLLKKKFQINCDILYPPVPTIAQKDKWGKKIERFVCLGRIAPIKRIEKIIDIIKGVRQLNYNVKLHIIGGLGDNDYGRFVRRKCEEEGDWVVLEGECFGNKKAKILAESAFGIHGGEGEAFGISVAEMLKAGCITYVPFNGGAAEIVGHDDLVYHDVEDAKNKIISALKSPEKRKKLFDHLKDRREIFTNTAFMKNLQCHVEKMLN